MLEDIELLSERYIYYSKTVLTSGNIGHPYKVVVDRCIGFYNIMIYKNVNYGDDTDELKWTKISQCKANQLAIRNNNCVLFRVDKYYIVSDMFYEFDSDTINKFVSVTNNGIPSGVAFTNTHVFILEWRMMIPLK